jgi:hypothetical protein
LPEICDLLVNKKGDRQVKEFLRDVFTLKDFNPLYKNILNIKLENIITTNVDNLFYLIVKDSPYFLRNQIIEGGGISSKYSINYIPLHGEVSQDLHTLAFTQNEIDFADKTNEQYFDLLRAALTNRPTLFIGYSFSDLAVYQSIFRYVTNKEKIWIFLLSSDTKAKDFYQQLGFNVVIGDVEEVLTWFGEIKCDDDLSSEPNSAENVLSEFSVPKISSGAAISQNDFYQLAVTNWYNVFFSRTIKTDAFYTLWKYVSDTAPRHVIALGVQGSGKTVLGMQLAKEQGNRSLFVSNIVSVEQAEHIKRFVKKGQIIIVDDCTNNSEAFNILLTCKDNTVIGLSENYRFESSLQYFKERFEVVDISDLSDSDLSKLRDVIPFGLRKSGEEGFEKEHCSMVEAMNAYVFEFVSFKSISKLISELFRKYNNGVFDLFCLCVYMTINKSALSMDLLISYFGSYDKTQDLVNKLKKYLISANKNVFLSLDETQDYFIIRSNCFARLSVNALINQYPTEYGKVLKRFIGSANTFNIPQLYLFVRSAFDADRFYRIFGKEAEPLYSRLFQSLSYSQSRYVLQQWSLYYGLCGRYSEAFDLIDRARSMGPTIWSFENTFAILQFNANDIEAPTSESINLLYNSMELLEKCYERDERKDIHVLKYSQFSVVLSHKYHDASFLEKAKARLEKAINESQDKHKYLNGVLSSVNDELELLK